MRSGSEVRERIKTWVQARALFFPPLYVGRETLDSIIDDVRRIMGENDGKAADGSTIQQRVLEYANRSHPDKATQYIADSVVAELRWALSEEDRGAIRRVIWDILVGQLHDAECTMRNEPPDIVLEGTACPFDPDHPRRSFRFWVRFKKAELHDDRRVWNPIERRFEDKLLSSVAGLNQIEKIWILYPDRSDTGFALTAQDDTLSGILRFSGADYDFRISDHKTSAP